MHTKALLVNTSKKKHYTTVPSPPHAYKTFVTYFQSIYTMIILGAVASPGEETGGPCVQSTSLSELFCPQPEVPVVHCFVSVGRWPTGRKETTLAVRGSLHSNKK